MKRFLSVMAILVAGAAVIPAWADYDPVLEAKEAAARKAAAEREAKRKAEADKVRADAKAKADAAYAKEMAKYKGRPTGPTPEQEAMIKQMSGKSMAEMSKMSDKELEAFSREMEKKYGTK